MAWFWMALASACLWGICYAAMEHLLKFFPSTVIMAASYLAGVSVWVGYLLFKNNGPKLLELVSGDQKYWMLAYILSAMVANFLLYQATALKGATLPAIVEISYPMFTALAVFGLLGGISFTPGMLAGSALIASGVACVYMWG